MACTNVTIFTAADTPLRADATIALTVVPPIQGHTASALVPFAWKVLTFHAHVSEQRQFRLYPARRITEVFVHSGDQTDQQFVTYSDNGAGLGPNQHLALESGRWTSDPLFDIPPDTSFAINRDIEDHLLSIGSSSPGIPFEPMILLPALKHKQGALFRYPCQLQAWEVESRCVVGQLLTDRGPGLFTVEGDPSPIDAGMLAGDVGFKLYTDSDGRLALETIQPRQILILHPAPLPLMIPRQQSSQTHLQLLPRRLRLASLAQQQIFVLPSSSNHCIHRLGRPRSSSLPRCNLQLDLPYFYPHF
ncbi:unnamed protein product [Somion occarium]|uniref:Uncharacterized protein n=1 Tax=Somion occarium TaxID=3059160 RepID=A0ABP1CMI1_9APHY